MQEWGAVSSGLKLPGLNHLETGSGVNIQCTKCSDFIIGKQTNFNGPVTIISCAEIMKQRTKEKLEDELVIRDKILSQSAAIKMTELAQEKEKGDKDTEGSKEKWRQRMVEKLMNLPKIPLFVCFGLLLSSAIASTIFLTTAPTGESVGCLSIGNDVCIYSGFSWGRRSIPEDPDLPLPYVIVFQTHHEFCYYYDECVKMIEVFYQDGLDKDSCSFFVGTEGNVYEGQGWGRGWTNSSEGIAARALRVCFMGMLDEEFPTYPQIMAGTELIRYAVDNDYVSENYVLAPSNAISENDDLGYLYNIIKKWPNFSENPFSKDT